ncbi:TPA: inorganic diphosphatase [Candidatus Woesearchaeota archaeon]|nr:inorganic diphosphatase [Candidatus Woesearchaeota archaeon]
MVHYWHDIPATTTTTDDFVHAVIEIPEGSSNKFEYDKEYGIIRLDRVLFTSTHYPANYGFVPRTYADDDDPLDILVLCTQRMVPGVLMRARVLGMFFMVDGDELDIKIIAASSNDPTFADIIDIHQLPHHVLSEMTHFFEVYKELEHKKTKVMKTKGRADALEAIEKSRKAYDEKFAKR